MQTASQIKVVLKWASIAMLLAACNNNQDFNQAIAKHKNTFVDQVNPAPMKSSVPFYTIETLNPTWDVSEPKNLVQIPNFSLIDQAGRPKDQSMFDEKITVLGFMFASCQGVCPFVVDGMQTIEKDYSGRVQFVAISVDPENDTPSELAKYAKQHKLNPKNWTMLTGNKDTIYSLIKKTLASQAFRKPTVAPNFIHSEHLYVIGPDRRLRGILNGTRIEVKKEAKPILDSLLSIQVATKQNSKTLY